jgi:hypothetical protein
MTMLSNDRRFTLAVPRVRLCGAVFEMVLDHDHKGLQGLLSAPLHQLRYPRHELPRPEDHTADVVGALDPLCRVEGETLVYGV